MVGLTGTKLISSYKKPIGTLRSFLYSTVGDMQGSSYSLCIQEVEAGDVIVRETRQKSWRHLPTVYLYRHPPSVLGELERVLRNNGLWRANHIAPSRVFLADGVSHRYEFSTDNEKLLLFSGQMVPMRYQKNFSALRQFLDTLIAGEKSKERSHSMQISPEQLTGLALTLDKTHLLLTSTKDTLQVHLGENSAAVSQILLTQIRNLLADREEMFTPFPLSNGGDAKLKSDHVCALQLFVCLPEQSLTTDYFIIDKIERDNVTAESIALLEQIITLTEKYI